MKKALTILAIMVIVAGALFADAPAGSTGLIKIKSTVERQDPTFIIKGFWDSQAVTGDEDGEDLFVNDISQGDVSVDFSIYQSTTAKNRYKYSFKVEVTKFVGATHNYLVDKDVTVGAPTGTWYTADAAEGIGFVDQPAVVNNELVASVTFNGNKAVVGSNDAKTSFNVLWKEDKAAPADDYEANVKMTVTVE